MTFGTGLLQVGSTGAGVTELQQWLIDRQFLIATTTPDRNVRRIHRPGGQGVPALGRHRLRRRGGGRHPDAPRKATPGTRRPAAGTLPPSATSADADPRRQLHHHHPPRRSCTPPRAPGCRTMRRAHPTSPSAATAPAARSSCGSTTRSPWPPGPLRHPGGTAGDQPASAPSRSRASGSPRTVRRWPRQMPTSSSASASWMRWVEANTRRGAARRARLRRGRGQGVVGGRVRLSTADWEASRGWLGHQHVPQNRVHWDPGTDRYRCAAGRAGRRCRMADQSGAVLGTHGADLAPAGR